MSRALTSTVAAVVLILVTVLLTGQTGSSPWPTALVGLIAGLAYAFGAWCAPLFAARGALGGTLFARWRRAWDRPKAVQVIAGAVAVAVFTAVGIFPGASAAAFGIAIALGAGAVLPVPDDAADSEDARRA